MSSICIWLLMIPFFIWFLVLTPPVLTRDPTITDFWQIFLKNVFLNLLDPQALTLEILHSFFKFYSNIFLLFIIISYEVFWSIPPSLRAWTFFIFLLFIHLFYYAYISSRASPHTPVCAKTDDSFWIFLLQRAAIGFTLFICLFVCFSNLKSN